MRAQNAGADCPQTDREQNDMQTENQLEGSVGIADGAFMEPAMEDERFGNE